MFGFSKKKTQVQEHIDQDGIEHATTRFSEIISGDLTTRELAYQFILEEVEAASQGNKVAMKFASESGISPSEYKGAMRKSCPEIDKPQQLLIGLSLQLKDDFNLMVEFRIKIDDKIMKKFNLGKYDKKGLIGRDAFNLFESIRIKHKNNESITCGDSDRLKASLSRSINEISKQLNGEGECDPQAGILVAYLGDLLSKVPEDGEEKKFLVHLNRYDIILDGDFEFIVQLKAASWAIIYEQKNDITNSVDISRELFKKEVRPILDQVFWEKNEECNKMAANWNVRRNS